MSSDIEITATRKARVGGLQPPRIFSLLACVVAAPFTGGASLVMIPLSEAMFSTARRDAIDEALINEPGTVEGSAERVRDQILSGSQYAHDRVSIPVDGFGDVVFDTTTEIRKEDDDD
jgi:hypothetical protein